MQGVLSPYRAALVSDAYAIFNHYKRIHGRYFVMYSKRITRYEKPVLQIKQEVMEKLNLWTPPAKRNRMSTTPPPLPNDTRENKRRHMSTTAPPHIH